MNNISTSEEIPVAEEGAVSTPAEGKKEQEDCVICMEEIKNKGTIGCQHLFCFDCILNWSKRTNSCPVCKRKFSKITTITEPSPLTKTGKKRKSMKPVTKTVKVKNKEQTVEYGGGGGGPGVNFDMNLFMTMVFAHMNNAAHLYDDEDDSDWNSEDEVMEDMMWGERYYTSDEDEEPILLPMPAPQHVPRRMTAPLSGRMRVSTPPRAIRRPATAPRIASRMSAPAEPVIIDLISDDEESPPRHQVLARAHTLPTTSSSNMIVDLSEDLPVSSSSSTPQATTSVARNVKRRRRE